ncbi:MAG: IclR family transcriptional regulator [Thermomicrobiales bacterium]
MTETPSGHIRSLDKGMEIVELLAAQPRGLSVAEIAKALGFNASTTHHLVATLRRRGFLDQDPETRVYRLGYRLVSLVNEFVSEADIFAVGAGPTRELRDASGDTAYLTVLQDRDIFVVFEATGFHPVQTRRPRLPGQICLHGIASGKTLLAYLPQERRSALLSEMPLARFTPNTIIGLPELDAELAAIRAQRYALDREEWLLGLACVAAPVFDRNGACVATASVAYPAVQAERREQLIRLVGETAKRISGSLGYVDRADPSMDAAQVA